MDVEFLESHSLGKFSGVKNNERSGEIADTRTN